MMMMADVKLWMATNHWVVIIAERSMLEVTWKSYRKRSRRPRLTLDWFLRKAPSVPGGIIHCICGIRDISFIQWMRQKRNIL